MNINKNSSILISGASGWLGSYVIKELESRGYTNLIKLNGKKHLDLTNENAVKTLFDFTTIDYCIHLGAKVGGISDNMKDPIWFFIDNMRMGINLIEQSILHNVKKFVLLSSVCAYPAVPPSKFFKESELWLNRPEPTNESYGLAKKSLGLLLEKSKGRMNGITLIPTNLFGPGFGEDTHVIPQIIQKIHKSKLNNEDVLLFGTGEVSREFLYIEDCSRGIVDAFEKYNGVNPINLGSGNEILINDLAYKIAEMMDFKGKIIFDNTSPNGQLRRCLDCSNAWKEFGFKAKVSLQEGLEATIKWYKEQL